jgi:plastocyanin
MARRQPEEGRMTMHRHTILRRALIGAALAAAALAAVTTSTVVAQNAPPLVAPGPNRLQFPADWPKQTMYATVDRHDTKQYREFYTSAEAVQAAREGKPIPDGTIITLAAYAAKLDADGKPVKDAGGRFVKDKLVAVNSMQKKAGWGADIPAEIRNGDWIYQSFTPDGQVNEKANLTSCYQCHLPFAKEEFLTNLPKLAGRFPTVANVAAKGGPSDVAISGFAFGPGTIRITTGQKVTWTNADDTPHQVSVQGARPQRSDVMLKGQEASLQFDEAGSYAYVCGLHPGMKGTIEVAPRQ